MKKRTYDEYVEILGKELADELVKFDNNLAAHGEQIKKQQHDIDELRGTNAK